MSDVLVVNALRRGARWVWPDGDSRAALGLERLDGPYRVARGGDHHGELTCLDLVDDGLAGFGDRVSGVLKELAARVVHGYGYGDVCVALLRPGFDPGQHCGGGAVLSVAGFYGDFVDHQDPVEDEACVVVTSVGKRFVGCLLVSSDERCSYQVAVCPRAYEGGADAVVVDVGLFGMLNEIVVSDMLGQEAADCFYVFFRSSWGDVELLPTVRRKARGGCGA